MDNRMLKKVLESILYDRGKGLSLNRIMEEVYYVDMSMEQEGAGTHTLLKWDNIGGKKFSPTVYNHLEHDGVFSRVQIWYRLRKNTTNPYYKYVGEYPSYTEKEGMDILYHRMWYLTNTLSPE